MDNETGLKKNRCCSANSGHTVAQANDMKTAHCCMRTLRQWKSGMPGLEARLS